VTLPNVRIVTSAPVATGTLLWRFRGQLHVSIAVKAAFALVHERAMELIEPVALVSGELHHRNNPARSVRATTDLVPYLGRADVVLVGHAYAPHGEPASKVSVRLAVLRDDTALVDKTLAVHGDRKGGAAQPFERIPLVYERALGGVGWDDNPFGVGGRAGAEPDTSAANILDPARPQRSAGFGPMSRAWPARRRLLGAMKRKAFDEPIIEIPEGFDWSFFQAAPVDQRTEHLRGDEQILLEGTHPHLPRIVTRLPDARVTGAVSGLSPGGARGLPLSIDMLRIDADEQSCAVVWRAVLPVRDEAMLAALEVTLALEIGGQMIEWSDEPEPIEAPETEVLDLDDAAPTLLRGDAKPPAARPALATMVLDDAAPPGAAALPFAFTPPERPEKPPIERTHGLSLDDQQQAAQKDVTPFAASAGPPESRRRFVGRPVPGAPWARAAPPLRSPEVKRRLDDSITIEVDPLGEAPPPPPPAPKPPLRPAAKPPRAPVVQPPIAQPPAAEPAPSRPPPPAPSRPPPARPPPPPPSRAEPRPQAGAASIARRAQDTVPVAGASPFTTFTLPWQMKAGKDTLAVIVKATCDLAPDGRLTLRDEADPPSGDLHDAGDPMRTLLYPSDFVPFKPRADVVLTGHAYAPGGSSVAAQATFRFGHRKNGFERRIAVLGERKWLKAGVRLAPTDPRPFKKVPLVYERAFGGAGFDRNPAGVGRDSESLPQLEDPAHLVKAPGDTPDPACFAGVPPLWPGRWGKLGTFDAAWKKSRWPYLPDDADWAFFQAAPAPQILDHLAGDEGFEIVGMHAVHPVLRGKLPGTRPRCFVQKASDAGGDFHEVLLRLDTVAFDADAMKVSLVWRGAIDVRDDEASDVAELFVLQEPLEGPGMGRAEALARYRAERAPPPEDVLAKPAANDALPPAERTPAEAAALRAEVVARLGSGSPLTGMDLADADLGGLDLSSQSLAGALLRRARLRGARLRGADLSGAQLDSADLADADLTGASVTGADFTGADLTGARFDGAVLGDALFRRARGDGARFEGARGEHASFEDGSWKKVRFAAAELTAADFSGSTLDGAVFDGASLVDVRLYDARGTGASFKGATLTRARADGAALKRCLLQDLRAPSSVWDKAVLDESTFLGAVLSESGFAKASCRRTIFSGADLTSGRLRRAQLQGASLLKANLMTASLEGANLEGADLRGANLHGAETHKAKLDGAQLDLAIVTQTKLARRS
jgi:uncharacterized protein YjbI with pentapeptide repeats